MTEKEEEKKETPEEAIERVNVAAARLEAGNKELATLLDKQEGMKVEGAAAAARLEAGNKELATLLDKQESMKVEATLGGEADAGAQKKTVEEQQVEAAKAYLEGTGLAEDAFPEEK